MTAAEAVRRSGLRWSLPPYPHPVRGPVPWREAPGNWAGRKGRRWVRWVRERFDGRGHGFPWPWGSMELPKPAGVEGWAHGQAREPRVVRVEPWWLAVERPHERPCWSPAGGWRFGVTGSE